MQLNGFEYFNLSYLIDNNGLNDLPEVEGIYNWVYWINFEPQNITTDELIQVLEKLSAQNLVIPSNFKNYKYEVNVTDRKFGENNLFGLSNDKKEILLEFIKSEKGKKDIHWLLMNIYFSKPFYVGKANNIKQRIYSHCRSSSKISSYLEESNIYQKNIWVGIRKTPLESNKDINVVFEEIMQKIIKPGLTEKAG